MSLLDRRRILPATALVAALALAGCGTIPQAGGATAPGSDTGSSSQPSGSQPSEAGSPSAPPSSTPTPDPVTLTPNVEDGAKNVKVSTVVAVKAANGTVGTVKLSYAGKDSKGKAVKGTVDGAMAKDKTGWTAGERLEPSATLHAERDRDEPRGHRDHREDHVHDPGADPAAADLRPAAAVEGQQGRRGDAGHPDVRRGGARTARSSRSTCR